MDLLYAALWGALMGLFIDMVWSLAEGITFEEYVDRYK